MREIRLMLVFVVLALVTTAAICWRKVDASPPVPPAPPRPQAATPGWSYIPKRGTEPPAPAPVPAYIVDSEGRKLPNVDPRTGEALTPDYLERHRLRKPIMPNGRPAKYAMRVEVGGTMEDDEGHEWLRTANGWVRLYPEAGYEGFPNPPAAPTPHN